MTQQWKTIDSAPKTGRTLLLGYWNALGKWRTVRGQWMSDECIAASWEEPDDIEAGWFETAVEAEDVPNCWPIDPTHWMPLPAEPSKYAGDHDGMDEDPRTQWQQTATPPASAQDDAKDDYVFGETFTRGWIGMEELPSSMLIGGVGPIPASTSCWITTDAQEAERMKADGPVLEIFTRRPVAAPAAGDARAWQGLTDAERDGYVGELVDYGTEFVSPLYSVVESIEKRLREKNGTQQGGA